MPDYSKTVIYKLCCKDVNITDIYVGHTTNFNERIKDHYFHCNKKKSKQHFNYVYYFIRENGGWDNWEMIKLYDHPCNTKKEACIEERKCFDKLGAKLNTTKPYESVEEKKENMKKISKKYNHSDKSKEYRKIKINCLNCNKLISRGNIQTHMQSIICLKTALKLIKSN